VKTKDLHKPVEQDSFSLSFDYKVAHILGDNVGAYRRFLKQAEFTLCQCLRQSDKMNIARWFDIAKSVSLSHEYAEVIWNISRCSPANWVHFATQNVTALEYNVRLLEDSLTRVAATDKA
jgi:hypothetical protein